MVGAGIRLLVLLFPVDAVLGVQVIDELMIGGKEEGPEDGVPDS